MTDQVRLDDKFQPIKVSNVTPIPMQSPNAERDAAIAEVHATFAKAGLCIVPVEALKTAIDILEGDSFMSAADDLRNCLPKE